MNGWRDLIVGALLIVIALLFFWLILRLVFVAQLPF